MFAYRCLDDRNYTTINAILMPRAKISRKSTVVDMTAMCDVAFINTSKGLHLTDAEMKNFYANPTAYIGVPFAYLKPLLDKDAEQLKAVNMQGIPCKDSTDNELVDWVGAAVSAFQGGYMDLMGDLGTGAWAR